MSASLLIGLPLSLDFDFDYDYDYDYDYNFDLASSSSSGSTSTAAAAAVGTYPGRGQYSWLGGSACLSRSAWLVGRGCYWVLYKVAYSLCLCECLGC